MAAVLNMVTKYGALDSVFGQPEYSQIPTAVIGIVMKFFQVIISISVGLAAGCIPVVGYNIGAKRNDRVLGIMKRLIAAEAIVGLVSSLVFVIFPYQLINIFGAANESVYYTDFAVKCIRIFLCLLALSCVNKGTFIFLQSIGSAKQSTALSLLREIVFGVGLPLLLPVFWGLEGILYFMPLADALTFIASVIVIIRTKRMLSAFDMEEGSMADSVPVYPESGTELTEYVITISRSYGAGGKTVGKLLADRLHIRYYDAELLEEAAKSSGMNKKFLESVDEKPVESSMLYQYIGFTSNYYASIKEMADQAQREIIERVASEGSCVIVGRRADLILKDNPNILRIFITASTKTREQRIAERDRISEANSRKKVARVDRERASYYNQYSEKKWGDASGYDLCVDTDKFGIDGTAEMLSEIILHDFIRLNQS